MKFLDRYLRSKVQTSATVSPLIDGQAVLVCVPRIDFDGMLPIHLNLEELFSNSSIGNFDGNEVGGGQTTLFLYGPDAELLFHHVEPVLRADEFCRGARIVIRWGGPDAPQREVAL